MNQLTFLRNRPTYRVERFLELKLLHEKGGVMSVGGTKVNQERKLSPDKPKHLTGGKSNRVLANVATVVRKPPNCHICGQQHFWRLCDKLKDPTMIASVAQTLLDKNFCLKCVRPQAICAGTCTGTYKLKDGTVISTRCKSCTDDSRHYKLCMCKGEVKPGVAVNSVLVSSQQTASQAKSSGIGTTKMLTEMIEFTLPGSDKTVTRLVM